MEDYLNIVLKSDSDSVPSLTQICKELNYNSYTLHKYFKKQCDKIVAKRLKKERLKRAQKLNKIRECIIELYSNGLYPTKKSVNAALEKNYLSFDSGAYELWHKTLKELGLR